MIEIITNFGTIVVQLHQKEAEASVDNFLAYIDDGFYDNTIFHRVIPNFVIQGGGLDENFIVKPTRPPIKNEADNGLKNVRGSIAMARTQEVNSATSQFFINLADNPFLDHNKENFGYAVFAHVTDGFDVIEKMVSIKTGNSNGYENVPKEVIMMQSVKKIDL